MGDCILFSSENVHIKNVLIVCINLFKYVPLVLMGDSTDGA